MATTNAQLSTSGLHCRSCSMMVDMTVGDLDGVASVETDYVTGVTKVEFDSDVVTLEGIMESIRAAGYGAEVSAT
ncbi:MAG: heavy-metal-associated domain-containing protein [Actinomycetota bacterium]|jgi:Cu+-exporting ATPase|nr:heavy-metal-associated domain-containing protein [Actinomycetota bacterium]